jgi:hypothetical protein
MEIQVFFFRFLSILKINFSFKQIVDQILPYSHLINIYINTNTEETSYNQDKLYCGCEHFPCLSIPYGYGRIDDDVLFLLLFLILLILFFLLENII